MNCFRRWCTNVDHQQHKLYVTEEDHNREATGEDEAEDGEDGEGKEDHVKPREEEKFELPEDLNLDDEEMDGDAEHEKEGDADDGEEEDGNADDSPALPPDVAPPAPPESGGDELNEDMQEDKKDAEDDEDANLGVPEEQEKEDADKTGGYVACSHLLSFSHRSFFHASLIQTTKKKPKTKRNLIWLHAPMCSRKSSMRRSHRMV